MALEFPDSLTGHDPDEYTFEHDADYAEHDNFHVHVEGRIADKSYLQLIVLDFAILFYLMLVLAHQCYFLKSKP